MDYRRLTTGDLVDMGITEMPVPPSPVPDDADLELVPYEWTSEGLLEGLRGGGIYARMYHGAFAIWPTAAGFSGHLVQYRAVTGSFAGADLEAAHRTAVEWATGCDEQPPDED